MPSPETAHIGALHGRRPVAPRASLREERLRSHRLTAPAASPGDAAAHMLAAQSQEFTGGRWALAVRTRAAVTLADVDAAFDRGELVRSWTMRGTIHIIPARDLAWVLGVTGDRQLRQAAGVHRAEGVDTAEIARAETAVRAALAGSGRLTRGELFAVLEGAGVSTRGQRGYHVLVALCLHGVLCQGPVVPRAGGPTREQYFVLTEDWVSDAASPGDPPAELFVRYIGGHGPAGPRDFAWWSGLPLGVARAAADAASDRLRVARGAVASGGAVEPTYVLAPAPRRRAGAERVLALPAFDEYYLSYADRTVTCAPQLLDRVGPSANGMVRPVLVADGEVIGTWTHSLAVGRHREPAEPELFTADAATGDDVAAALARYAAFVGG